MKSLFKILFNFFNKKFLGYLEFNYFNYNLSTKESKPVFILGAPRSGTTILMQIIINNFDFCYFSNWHLYFYGFPALLKKFFFINIKNKKVKYISNYGNTFGLDQPNEMGSWWYRFFKQGDFQSIKEKINYLDQKKFIKSLLLFSYFYKKPFINKNVYNSLRIESINDCFKNSLFIVIKRKKIDNCISILNARTQNGNINKWWSIPIKRKKFRNIYEEVVHQVTDTNQYIDKTLKKIKKDRNQILHISYENLCNNPDETLNNLDLFFKKNDLFIKKNKKSISGVKKIKNQQYKNFHNLITALQKISKNNAFN